MKKEEMWNIYKKINNGVSNYLTSSFDDDLIELIISGKKTATSSLFLSYDLDKLPKVGDYNIIVNEKKEAKCIIKIVNVYKSRFNEVSISHAFKEGEGNRSLEYWQEVHKVFFEEELKKIGKTFNSDIIVLCEEFELVYF